MRNELDDLTDIGRFGLTGCKSVMLVQMDMSHVPIMATTTESDD